MAFVMVQRLRDVEMEWLESGGEVEKTDKLVEESGSWQGGSGGIEE
jgi:hypothetical protein